MMWLGGLLVLEAGLGSSILPSGVHSSRVEIACEGWFGRCLLGRPGLFGIGAAGRAPGPMGRWELCGLGRIGSIRSRVMFGGGSG